MHTILFKFKTIYSLVSYWYNCFKYHYITNNPKLFIYSSRQLFYKTPQYVYIHVCYTHLYNWSALSCYSTTAAFNDCYSELKVYTVLAYSYWVSFHDAYHCQGHAHYRYRLQFPYNMYSCRTYLTNLMGSISCH